MLDISKIVEGGGNMEIPATALAYSSTIKGFRESFCVDEVAKADFPKLYFGSDLLLLIPGEQVVGKGLQSKLERCIITIRKDGVCFIYNDGDLFEDSIAQPLDDKCMFIFVGDAEEAYILLPGVNDSEQQLFRLEADVEVGVYLETDLYRGRNGYHLCLIKDTNCGMNMCSATADPRTAEFMFRLFIAYYGC